MADRAQTASEKQSDRAAPTGAVGGADGSSGSREATGGATELHSGFTASSPHLWQDVLADLAAEADQWVAATKLRNFINEDPLLDWLAEYGAGADFASDSALPGYREELDFSRFVMEKGVEFEQRITDLLRERADELGHEVFEIHRGAQDLYDATSFIETINAMAIGTPIIYQGWLIDPDLRTFGAPDLIIRADVLEQLFPGTVPAHEALLDAPLVTLGGTAGHYRAVDIKFTTLELNKDGAAASKLKSHAAQLWLYNQMLGAIQGLTPPSAYLLGRTWQSGSGKTAQRGGGAFERLARVDADHSFGRRGSEVSLRDTVAAGLAWRRRLMQRTAPDATPAAAGWQVLPTPSMPELYPNASYTEDAPWHTAKRQIIAELGELTQLPGVNAKLRNEALKRGISSWRDPRASAETLGVTGAVFAVRCDAVLAANRLLLSRSENGSDGLSAGNPPSDPRRLVLPAQISKADMTWRTPAPLELWVDFESVSTLDDDFSALPAVGGQALIFQIGCGIYEPRRNLADPTGPMTQVAAPTNETQATADAAEDMMSEGGPVMSMPSRVAIDPVGSAENAVAVSPLPDQDVASGPPDWSFAQWTARALAEEEELRIIGEWVAHMDAERQRRGLRWDQVRIYHWSSAETSTLESAYSSARRRLAARHQEDPDRYPAADWPDMPWYDLLAKLVRAEPITVAGAFNFGLKSIAKAMYSHGLIETKWGDGPTDGLGAMVGAWRADATARQIGVSMKELALMLEIAAYNDVDCQVMAEIVTCLRTQP